MKQRRTKTKKKPKPVNEISDQEVDDFLNAVRSFDGYPRLRELPKLLPSMNTTKINAILRFLERSGVIIIDSDGYIVWSRGETADRLTLAEVAEIAPAAKEFFEDYRE
ncbi:MAG: hypothetical protein ABI361_03540 [Nitrososphaera sp.]|jgi:hypothetical protein